MTRRRSARGEQGFTLVEMMIALMIFGMIAAAGVGLLSFSVRAQAATATKLDDVAAIARLSSALGGDLAQAVDRPARDREGITRPAFAGEAGTTAGAFLTFTRGGWGNLDDVARPSLQKVEWRWNAGTIERVGFPMVDGAEPLPAAAVIDGVLSVALRYRVAGAWSDRWDGAGGVALPQAVELVIVRTGGPAFRQLFLVGSPSPPRPEEPTFVLPENPGAT